MTTLQVASDLHLEFITLSSKPDVFTFFEELIKPSADVLALVGDIGSPLHPLLELFLGWCSSKFQQVYFVHGNHELYSRDPSKDVETMIGMIASICQKWPNVHYLHNKSHVYKGVCFIGSTLWSYIPPEHASLISQKMNDYRYIYARPGVLATTTYTSAEFENNKRFLETEIARAVESGYWPVILTHHMPWMEGTSHPMYDGSPGNAAFASNMRGSSDMIQLWAAGHTHYNFGHRLAGYELVSNQRGYDSEKATVRTYKNDLSIVLHASPHKRT